MAPPHHQPMSEIHDVDLGFTTLEDWFNGSDSDLFGGLDLQDFWLQVGPGEVRAPARCANGRRKEDSPSGRLCILFALSKDSGAYADAVATLFDCLYEICTHAHAQFQIEVISVDQPEQLVTGLFQGSKVGVWLCDIV